MNRIAEVSRLKELEAKATNAPWTLMGKKDFQIIAENPDFYINFEDSDKDDPQLITDLRNAAPWLLAVAGKFQPRDNAIAFLTMEFLRGCGVDEASPMMDYIRRMAEAASIMEADG
jgi:hypothetical protein